MATNGKQKLDSWKEIAAYLQKDERTVMRWAKLGLPVHRSPAEKRGRVFAYAEEIDKWLRTQNPGSLNHENQNHDASLIATDVAEAIPAVEVPREAEPLADTRPASALVAPHARHHTKRQAWIVATLILVPLTGFAGWHTWWYAKAQPADFRIDGNRLIVMDENGRKMWYHDFAFVAADRLELVGYVPKPDQYRFIDLDGDGNLEFLIAILPKYSPGPSGSLACFDRRGNKRWEYVPGRKLRYGEHEYPPPFSLDSFRVVAETDGGFSIWVVSHQIPWFPAVLARLDENGRVLGEHWHPGHIGPFAEATIEGRRVMLVGATNNEHFTASLAVVDYENPTGWSPAGKRDYRCSNCPGSAPLAYLLFPRSEIADLLGVRQTVRQIWVRESGHIEVTVAADTDVGGNTPSQTYGFDGELRQIDAEIVESYVYAHNELQKLGVLKHGLDRKRESELIKPVLHWDGSRFSKYTAMRAHP